MAEINKRVLSKIEEELTPCFPNLKIIQEKGGASGRQVVALKFTFNPQIEKRVWTERDVFETKFFCRYCREPLYAIFRKDTGEMFYGHKDGWKADAPCRRTYSSIDEIIGYYEGDEEAPEDIPKERNFLERAGFSCRECGRPLYVLYNRNGEMFYGHADGARPDAICRKTYGSIAELRGYNETPDRYSPNFDLVEEGSEEEADGTFRTKK